MTIEQRWNEVERWHNQNLPRMLASLRKYWASTEWHNKVYK